MDFILLFGTQAKALSQPLLESLLRIPLSASEMAVRSRGGGWLLGNGEPGGEQRNGKVTNLHVWLFTPCDFQTPILVPRLQA